MGMFDWYVPQPDVRCPGCGATLGGWQGKDGACALFEWVQGTSSPVRQLVDEDAAALPEIRDAERLPDEFELYNACRACGAWVKAEGACEAGTWTHFALLDPLEAPGLPDDWATVDTDDRIRLLAELRRELANGHLLHGARVTPIARRRSRDQVLLRARGLPAPLFVVHLTWQRETDIRWPRSIPLATLAELEEL